MTTLTIPKPIEVGFWSKIWRALSAFDEAVYHDPAEALQRRVVSLEARLKDLETERVRIRA